jgi:hypothetical protein
MSAQYVALLQKIPRDAKMAHSGSARTRTLMVDGLSALNFSQTLDYG